jgi:hypothetical protein
MKAQLLVLGVTMLHMHMPMPIWLAVSRVKTLIPAHSDNKVWAAEWAP